MPSNEVEKMAINRTLDVDAMLPKNRAYFTYEVRLRVTASNMWLL
jgi:carbonic anhydrase